MKEKVEPLPSSDSKLTLPPNFSTIYCDIMRPRPIPFTLRCWSSWTNPNSLNSLSWFSLGIPIPVSITDIFRNFLSVSSPLIISIFVYTLPCWVNFSALAWIPSSTCIILCSSQQIMGLSSPSSSVPILRNSAWNSKSLSLAFWRYMLMTFSTLSLMLNTRWFFRNLFPLIWAKSRRS